MCDSIRRPILELFKSIQGEGKYIGTFSIFIRFTKCNLRCNFCDTKYSWDEVGTYSIFDAIEYIQQNSNIKHIVITGGEPLLYQKEIIDIIKSVCRRDQLITIETNGTLEPCKELLNLMKYIGFWSVSPKTKDWKYDIFSQLNNIQFKFVVLDVSEIDTISKLNLYDMIIQPNGLRHDYNTACEELVNYIKNKEYYNIRVLPQFHRIIWKQKRGI